VGSLYTASNYWQGSLVWVICLIVRICLLYSVYMFTYSVYMFIKTGEVNSLTWPKNGHNGPTRHAEPLAW